MLKFVVSSVCLFITLLSISQEKVIQLENLSDCVNAYKISGLSETLSFQLNGNFGQVNDLEYYPEINKGIEGNSAWFVYTPEENGRLSLNVKTTESSPQLVIFQNITADFCRDLQKKIARVERKVLEPTKNEIGLNLLVNQNISYPLELRKDDLVLILIQTNSKQKETVKFNYIFESFKYNQDTVKPIKITDFTNPRVKSKFKIKVRDIETGKAILSSVTLTETKTMNGLYMGSDFCFAVDKPTKVKIRIDALGYFFSDLIQEVPSNQDFEIYIYLIPISPGKSVKLDGIEFISGESDFMPTAEVKLLQLKDFLKTNVGVNIEVQGHVYTEKNEKSVASMRLSEERAKKVYNYLVENGIDKKRITYKGYGGTRPVYARPITMDQEQANRRVEVKIF